MLESILDTTTGAISTKEAILCIGVALGLGLIISLIYIFSDRKRRISTNFAITLVILPAIVSVVIMLVGSNVARAFSMAGAFALVRFRSIPGDSKDITSVFFAMAIGLATGLGYISFAVIVTGMIGVIYLVLMISGFAILKATEKTLKITIPENLNYQGAFDDLFEEFTKTRTLERVRTTNLGSLYELTYLVTMKKDADEKKFIDELRCRNGNLNISLCNAEIAKELL
ncbi:MAG: DUF4956 domain-containing protein [Lachnospiraceae bacterium]|nr:DUF4956 domain-containing protein [Lachnospiraceae bacterium]